MDDRQSLLDRIAELEAENAELRRRLEQVEQDLHKIYQRGKRSPAKNNQERGRRKLTLRPQYLQKHFYSSGNWNNPISGVGAL